jgi:hypothetical protein
MKKVILMGCFFTAMSFAGIKAQTTTPPDNDTQEAINEINGVDVNSEVVGGIEAVETPGAAEVADKADVAGKTDVADIADKADLTDAAEVAADKAEVADKAEAPETSKN